MSEEKKTPVKKAEPGKGAKVLNWFKTLPQRIAKPFRNMYYELKKVTWPTKQRLISYSIIVLAFMLVMGVVIGLLDMGASAGVRSLIPSSTSTAAAASTTDVAEEAAGEAEEAAETAEAAVEEAAETVEEQAAETAETAAESAEQAAETVENAVEDTTAAVENATENADAAEGN
ncbi:MAG: preprotein translocase subunit SecE [Clostridia bacterium]|nr:preprotein translocase subunit SecE [Clostridia bacterium]